MAIDIIARGMIEESYGDISHLSEQIDIHTGNGNIHVTTVDKNKWNGYDAEIKQNKTDILNNKNDISQLFDITKGGKSLSGSASYTISNAVDYPLLGLSLYGKSTQDGTPTPEAPVDIISVGDSGSVEITADNGEKSTAATITSALPLCGIPVSSGGNYTDNNGQQWICDELIYNADGTGKIIKRTAKIDSYNGEAITTPYISTTGALTTGATVIYALAEPQEIELTAADVSALMQLHTYNGMTSISNSGNADMDVKYCTDKSLSEYVLPVITNMQAQIDELKSAVLSLGSNV